MRNPTTAKNAPGEGNTRKNRKLCTQCIHPAFARDSVLSVTQPPVGQRLDSHEHDPPRTRTHKKLADCALSALTPRAPSTMSNKAWQSSNPATSPSANTTPFAKTVSKTSNRSANTSPSAATGPWTTRAPLNPPTSRKPETLSKVSNVSKLARVLNQPDFSGLADLSKTSNVSNLSNPPPRRRAMEPEEGEEKDAAAKRPRRSGPADATLQSQRRPRQPSEDVGCQSLNGFEELRHPSVLQVDRGDEARKEHFP